MDTIVALASAPGRAGVAVIRVSGSEAWRVCEKLCGSVPPARRASLRKLSTPDGDLIDEALVLVFNEGESFTGEKVAEFHVHGSSAVISVVLAACLAQDGTRGAEAGEFTRRAYEAGRMSIMEVEGLGDLIDAETDLQRRQALRLMGGEAERKLSSWRDALLQALVNTEAEIDFSDEELPIGLKERTQRFLGTVRSGIEAELAGRALSERLREGFEVAIIGEVNVGKSTLLNALAGREAAITSEYAGTTRDVIEVRMDIAGYPVTLIDTAGLRETSDPVEIMGIDRGAKRAEQADLRVYLKASPHDEIKPLRDVDIVTLSKCDIWETEGVSGKTGEGLEQLVEEIVQRLGTGGRSSSVFSRARHFSLLYEAATTLRDVEKLFHDEQSTPEIMAEQIRSVVARLDMIMGRIDVEEVLGGIFSSFCIGK